MPDTVLGNWNTSGSKRKIPALVELTFYCVGVGEVEGQAINS